MGHKKEPGSLKDEYEIVRAVNFQHFTWVDGCNRNISWIAKAEIKPIIYKGRMY